jgi:FtsP/CotA-like multicopper oxidase with cupredoxin domain
VTPASIRRRRLLQAALALPFAPSARAGCAPPPWPVSGARLRALPELELDRDVSWGARGTLRAATADVLVAGQPARLLTYAGDYPGKLMRARAGETLALRFENRLDIPSNVHFHGLAVSPSGQADNIWVVVPPGAEFDYELPILESEAGLFWIHPHVHGNTAKPLFAGLAAPLLVEHPIDSQSELSQAEEHVIVLKDLTLENCAAAPHRPRDWVFGKEGELLLVNGQLRPQLHASRSLVRLRIVNASNARYWNLALDGGEPLHLIALDGRFLESRVEVAELLLVPAARAEVLVDLSRGGPRKLLYRPSPRRGWNQTPVQPIMTLRPPPSPAPVALPGRLVSPPRFDPRPSDTRRKVQLASLMINHRAFHHHHQGMHVAPAFEIDAGAREIWTVRNDDVMDHPLHLHTWHFQVLSVNGRAPDFVQHRDLINLRPGDVAELGIHFDRYTGRTMFHCHIAEHADQGMMAVIEVR